MVWIVSIVVALIAYFIHRTLHRRNLQRTHYDQRPTEQLPESTDRPDTQSNDLSKNTNNTEASAQNRSLPSQPAPHESPSLLYAERSNGSPKNDSNNQLGVATDQPAANSPQNDYITDATLDRTINSMDNTAETATLGIDSSTTSANSSAHEITPNSLNKFASGSGGNSSGGSGSSNTNSSSSDSNLSNSNAEFGIDLELGDNTQEEPYGVDAEEHDELLDFGDLTADISEMLKELNLRDTDSPRLEIDPEEFQQLKTGEPGEVKPEKIEHVAGKLRDMLQ